MAMNQPESAGTSRSGADNSLEHGVDVLESVHVPQRQEGVRLLCERLEIAAEEMTMS